MLRVLLLLLLLPGLMLIPPPGQLPARETAGGSMEPLPKLRAGTPPYSVLGNVLGANQKALGGVSPEAEGIREKDAPHLVWLADSDARIRSDLIWEHRIGGIYAVRNLANQLEPGAAAVDYGVRHLYAPLLLITGNSDSKSIELFNQGYEELGTEIRRELNHLHPALAHLEGAGKTARSSEALAALRMRQVESNVDYQVSLAMERYRDRIENGRLVVVGGVIDLANYYKGGPGRLYLINLNGETDPKKIQSSPHLVRVTPEMRHFIGR